MRDDLTSDLTPGPGEIPDPKELARRDLVKHLPKRFYAEASVGEREGSFALLLDGRGAKTPGRAPLAHASRVLMEAVAAEWSAQTELIDPATMPVTRILNSAFDGVSREMEAVRAEIVKYSGSDLLTYRGGEPASLVEAENAAWNPVLDWARETLGARFALAEGVMFVAQPEDAVAAVAAAVDAFDDPARLAGLHVMTTLTGSALLALAVARGFLTAEAAWAAAHVDEDHQMRLWGADEEALARRARRWDDMKAAALVTLAG